MSAVLMLHAFPCDQTMWAAQAAALASAGFDVVVPDIPGFGGSELPHVDPDLAHVADDLLGRLAGEPAHIVGLSLGGYLAMEMLRQQPALIRSLCLVDTKAGADDVAARLRRLEIAEAALATNSSALLTADLPRLLLGPAAQESRTDLVQRVESWIRATPGPTIAWYQRAMANRPDSHGVLGAADIPITLIWGDADVLSSRQDQEQMLAAVPSAKFRVVSDAGHLSAIEFPEQVSGLLLEHLTTQQRFG